MTGNLSNIALVSPVERELCEFFHELNQSSSLGLTGSEVVSLAKGNFVPSSKKCPQKRPPLPELIQTEDTTDISNVQLCGKEAPKQTSVGGAFQQIQESFRPAEWFSEVMPKRSPYFPQLGDELVYFRQGHGLYVRQVENLNIYQMDKKMQKSSPYVQDPDLPPEISVRVVHIAFELQPPRLVNLKLERVDWNTGLHTGNSFNVRYHDLPSIADFLVLRQIYDKSVRHQWHADDRFRCMMDKTWWLGTVLAKQPYDSQYENSNFQCYSIIWDGEDQEPEQLSPWDMEIIPDDFVVPEDSKDRVPATDEEVRSSLYEVRPEDWEPHGHQDAECRRISTLVEGVMNLAIAEAFLTPVDLNAWPEYAYAIAYPMDLSTIKARLDNLFYRRAPAILTDVERIGMNVAEFNEPNSDIVKAARVVTKLLQEIVENEDFGYVSEAYHRLMASVSEETSAVAAPVSKVIDQPLPFPKIIKPPPPRKVIKPPPPPKVIEPPKVTLSSPKKCPQKRPPLPELIQIEDTTDISNVQLCGKEAPKQTSVGGAFQQIQESFRPAEWFSEVMPKRSPYFPQLGDELVYFRQGHGLYVRQVENLNIYQMDKKMQKSLPYVQDPDLPPEISVRVVHIAFELQPPRLVNLKLERVDWNTGLHTGNSFNVRYHDLPSIADFLVLRQIYDKSVRHQWHADDRFRCMMDKTWWLGTVLAKQPYDSQYENSNFQCYSIIWDGEDQEPEQLSPWDMEIIPDDFVVPEDSKDRVPATDEEVRSSLYEVRPEDWEPHGHQDAECRRISTLVEGVMNLAIAEAFLTPVDLNAWPEYAYAIAYPMDLSTIKARLDNLFYRRAPAILTDVERIGMNAAEFNEPNSDIVKAARVVTKLLQEIVENEDFGNVSEAYHRLMASVSEETSAVAPTSPKKLKVCGEYSM